MKTGGLAALLLTWAGPAMAQPPDSWVRMVTNQPTGAPVRTAALGPGEQLLELGGLGYVAAPSDRVELAAQFMVIAEPADPAAAERALAERRTGLRAALVAAGVPAEDVLTASDLPVGTTPTMIDVAPDGSASTPIYPETVRIRMRPEQLPAVRDVLARFSARETGRPVYFLADPAPSRRAARLDALARIQARAEVQAQAAGLRVLRIMRISERGGVDAMAAVVADVQAIRGQGRPLNPVEGGSNPVTEVVTLLNVDFALGPR